MKKAKFILKVKTNGVGKIYVNKKWLKDVTKLNLYAEPWMYYLTVEQFKKDKNGLYYFENDEIAKKTTTYVFGHK